MRSAGSSTRLIAGMAAISAADQHEVDQQTRRGGRNEYLKLTPELSQQG